MGEMGLRPDLPASVKPEAYLSRFQAGLDIAATPTSKPYGALELTETINSFAPRPSLSAPGFRRSGARGSKKLDRSML